MNKEYMHHIEGNKYLVLHVNYVLGGYADPCSDKRGITLNFIHTEIDNGSRKFMAHGDGNCKLFVKELKRKSQKQIDLFYDYVETNIEKFIDAFYNDRNNLFVLIENYLKK